MANGLTPDRPARVRTGSDLTVTSTACILRIQQERSSISQKLVSVCLALMAVVASVSGLDVAQQDVALTFHGSQTTVLWIINSYTLTLAALLLPLGCGLLSVGPQAGPAGRPDDLRADERGRNVIERAFNGFKHRRGLAIRYDKHAVTYRGGLVLAASLLWLADLGDTS
jgi:hypothetical protein